MLNIETKLGTIEYFCHIIWTTRKNDFKYSKINICKHRVMQQNRAVLEEGGRSLRAAIWCHRKVSKALKKKKKKRKRTLLLSACANKIPMCATIPICVYYSRASKRRENCSPHPGIYHIFCLYLYVIQYHAYGRLIILYIIYILYYDNSITTVGCQLQGPRIRNSFIPLKKLVLRFFTNLRFYNRGQHT